jgi:hypothetical protein
LSALQSCRAGAEILLRGETFSLSGGILTLPPVALTLRGESKQGTCTTVQGIIKTAKGATGTLLCIEGLTVEGGLDIEDNTYQNIVVKNCCFRCTSERNCVTIGTCGSKSASQGGVSSGRGKVLFQNCEILGGTDSVKHTSDVTRLHIFKCHIRSAKYRGIFADAWFVLEDTVISGCGAYGIKCTIGVEVRGDLNDIQEGPYDAMGGNGGMSRSGGMLRSLMDHHDY